MVKINGKEAADVCGMTVSQYLDVYKRQDFKHLLL